MAQTPHPTSRRSATFCHKGRRGGGIGVLALLPLWEKVDRRASAETDEGLRRACHRSSGATLRFVILGRGAKRRRPGDPSPDVADLPPASHVPRGMCRSGLDPMVFATAFGLLRHRMTKGARRSPILRRPRLALPSTSSSSGTERSGADPRIQA